MDELVLTKSNWLAEVQESRVTVCNIRIVVYESLQVRMEVDDLFLDLADGRKLLKLLEIISGEKLGKPNNGRMRVHKVENVNKSLAFLHTKVSRYDEKNVSFFFSFSFLLPLYAHVQNIRNMYVLLRI